MDYAVVYRQHRVDITTMGDLIHATNRLIFAAPVEERHRLRRLHLEHELPRNVGITENAVHNASKAEYPSVARRLDMAAVHDASFVGQPAESSQHACALLLPTTRLLRRNRQRPSP